MISKIEKFFYWATALVVGAAFLVWQIYQPIQNKTDLNLSRAAFLIPIFLLAIFCIIWKSIQTAGQRGIPEQDKRIHIIYLVIILALGLLLRVLFSTVYTGFPNDMAAFKSWAQKVAEDLPGFYTGDGFADYPPGYMYILFIIGNIAKWLNLTYDSAAYTALIKLPAMIGDIGMAFLVYKLTGTVESFKNNPRTRLFLTAIIVFNPVVFFISSIWGQVDIILSLALVTAILYLIRKKYVMASVFYAIALLIKPQTLIFMPVLIFELFRNIFDRDSEDPHPGMTLFYCFLAGMGVFAAGVLPFTLKMGSVFWIVEQYLSPMGEYSYSSVNAFNLFTLFGQNWEADNEVHFLISNFAWGMLFNLSNFVFGAWLYFKAKNTRVLPLVGSLFLITLFFNLSSRVHDRYAFVAIFLLMLIYIFEKDIRYLYLLVLFVFTQSINYVHVFIVYLGTPYKNYLETPSVVLGSFANLAVLALIIYTGWTTLMRAPADAGPKFYNERRRTR